MSGGLFDRLASPASPQKPAEAPSPAREARELLKAKRCAFCNSDVAPFGRGDPRRLEAMVWACELHRERLG